MRLLCALQSSELASQFEATCRPCCPTKLLKSCEGEFATRSFVKCSPHLKYALKELHNLEMIGRIASRCSVSLLSD